jgi:hypothetical protein
MKQPIPGADTPASIPYHEINPLIDERPCGMNTVAAALRFIAKAFIQADADDGIPLDYTECWGVSCLLQTCAVALEVMDRERGKA